MADTVDDVALLHRASVLREDLRHDHDDGVVPQAGAENNGEHDRIELVPGHALGDQDVGRGHAGSKDADLVDVKVECVRYPAESCLIR